MYLYLFTSTAWKFICTVCSTGCGLANHMTSHVGENSKHKIKQEYRQQFIIQNIIQLTLCQFLLTIDVKMKTE